MQTGTMQIEADNQLRVTWDGYDKPIHTEIIRRLKLISGATWDDETKCWWVPPAQGDKLMAAFPKASYDVEAIWRCTDAHSNRTATFYTSLVALGVQFAIDASGAIVGVGEGVSPLFQQLVDERAHAFRPLVAAAHLHPRPMLQPYAPWQGPLTAEDAKFEPLLKGIQNAKKAAEEQELRYPKRRRKAKVKQGRLGL